MNVKPQAIGARLAAPGEDIRLYLLHGPDEAAAMALASRLGVAMGDTAERIDLDGATLRAEPGRLTDEAASMSLFGDRRYIRVTGAGEECLEAFTMLLAAPRAGNPVVAIAPTVKKTGKVVKLAASARNALECALYPPEGADAVRLVSAMARDLGLRLGAQGSERLIAATGGDRAVLASELEKLALYLDAAPDHPVEADGEAIDAIAAALEDDGMFPAIEAIIAGDAAAASIALQRVTAENTAIPMLRQLGTRLIKLADMRREMDQGESAETVIERHRVFWKEKPVTLRALRKWSSPQLARAIDRVRTSERASTAPRTPGTILIEHEGVAIARAASRFG